MHLFQKLILFLSFFFFHQNILFATANIKLVKYKTDKVSKVTLKVSLSKEELLYNKYLNFSINNPHIKIESWKTSIPPIEYIGSKFKGKKQEKKKVFNKDFFINLKISKAQKISKIDNVNIHMTYYLESSDNIIEKIIPLPITNKKNKKNQPLLNTKNIEKNINTTKVKKSTNKSSNNSLSQTVFNLVKKTESVWLRIFLAFLLGVLMSLTPCIYPMIPITVGILQSQGEKSIYRNFLLSLSYTFGVATTFALLGLMAAFTGQVFGSLLSNPIFVTILIIFLGYLALSMFGFYDMYTPKFLQNNSSTHSGSLISIFLFGAISGTVASPCLSPGLILLLSIVSTIGNKMLGFILLFNFGLGLGLPLLIIGTFSTSLNILPRAGTWMIEIKKLFGFMLFGMIFYFLNNIVAWHTLLWIISIFSLISGIMYIYISLNNKKSSTKNKAYNILGMLFCTGSIILGFKSYQETFLKKSMPIDTFWEKNYQEACNRAKKENKYLFLDIGAPFCSMCKVIDKTVFHDKNVQVALNKFVNVKIDGSCDKHFTSLKKKYNIIGFPAFLLINPKNEALVKKWASELYDIPNEQFIEELKQY